MNSIRLPWWWGFRLTRSFSVALYNKRNIIRRAFVDEILDTRRDTTSPTGRSSQYQQSLRAPPRSDHTQAAHNRTVRRMQTSLSTPFVYLVPPVQTDVATEGITGPMADGISDSDHRQVDHLYDFQ